MKILDRLYWKGVFSSSIARFLARSYYITQLARLVVASYDNDGNGDMNTNGEAWLLKVISSKMKNSSTFVDVGANVGDWSSALVGSGFMGRLIAVDPLKRNLAKVRERLVALKYASFELCEYALSNKIGSAKFFTNKDPTLSGHDSLYDMRTIGYRESVDSVDVRCLTLDELAAQFNISRIDFLKIDVEGNELFVLQGARSLLSSEAIDFIQIEFGHAARGAKVYLHDIVNFVSEYDLKIFVIKPSGLLPLVFSPFTENRYSYINFLLVRGSACDTLKEYILWR